MSNKDNNNRQQRRESIRKQWEQDQADVLRRQSELKNAKEAASRDQYWCDENDDGTLNKG